MMNIVQNETNPTVQRILDTRGSETAMALCSTDLRDLFINSGEGLVTVTGYILWYYWYWPKKFPYSYIWLLWDAVKIVVRYSINGERTDGYKIIKHQLSILINKLCNGNRGFEFALGRTQNPVSNPLQNPWSISGQFRHRPRLMKTSPIRQG